ncbi:MAG: lamin tail domain-containing protein, partial [Spartobacteria bacterium]|nr:lamin tail domain-containing protein [Spartobacteria bacterium]
MKTRYFFWGLLVSVALGFSLLSMAEEPAGVFEEAYADLMANEVLDLQDLADGAEIQRRMFNHMTPSGFSWLQPMFPPVAPFDAGYFDEAFLDGLLGEETNSVAVYPLSLVLDPKTRETLIYNAEGKIIATVPSDGVNRTWPEDADPARVTLQLDLLPTEDVEPYLYVEDRVAIATASKSARTPKDGGVVIMNMMVGSTNFGILSFQRLTNGNMQLAVTNGMDVAEVYSYTVWHTSTVTTNEWVDEYGVTNIGTNTLWTPVSPTFNGLESDWECQETNLVLAAGVGVWEDSSITSNARVRFYGVAKKADGDWDGLTDGAELFVHHTSPTNADTDGDGWNDGEEISAETDPLDRFSATRLAKGVLIHGVCYNPSNGLASSNQWVQLHSSSASPVNLGNFRLQVAGSNYATKLSFPSNTWIQPGHFILVGGSNVAGSDYLASLDLPNSYSTNPTAGARLVGPDGVDADPADVVVYGTHSPFNEGGLPTNGWGSTNTDLWAGRSNQLVRTRLGQDADLRSDWTYRLVSDLWNSEIVLDTDGDGLTDSEEYSGSVANGVQSNPLDPDTDNDGLEDGFEADHGLNPANSDS